MDCKLSGLTDRLTVCFFAGKKAAWAVVGRISRLASGTAQLSSFSNRASLSSSAQLSPRLGKSASIASSYAIFRYVVVVQLGEIPSWVLERLAADSMYSQSRHPPLRNLISRHL